MKTLKKANRLDWSQEKTLNRNFCGYCNNTAASGSCDGNCFTRNDFSEKKKLSDKITHLKDEIERLHELRIELAARKKLLDQELRILGEVK